MSTAELDEKRNDKNLCASSKSMESLYSLGSANSKLMLQRRKSLSIHSGNASSLSKSSEVRQRVISARMLRFKNLQNQLTDALQHISALTNENRLLKTLHKRQDAALAKYEGTNAALPQLLRSHAEELRVWHTKYRALTLRNRELNAQLKQKEEIIMKLSERNKHLTQLNDDKNLESRETLSGKVHYLELRMAEKDEQIKLLMRRNNLEAKNFKVQLHNEQKKYKTLCQKMENVTTKMHVPIVNEAGEVKLKTSSSLLPRLIPKKSKSDDEEPPTAFKYSKRPANEMYVSQMCGSHSDSDDGDDENEIQKEITNNRNWFSRDEFSEDDDLILKKIQSDELIDDEKSLLNHFNEMSLNGDGDGFENGIETNECEKLELDGTCCIDDAKKEENKNAGGETNRTTDIGIDSQIPRRMTMDSKKKTQLLAALKSIDTKK